MKKLLLFTLLLYIKQANAQIITTVVGNGILGYNGDGGQATAAELNQPFAVTFDNNNNFYISDVVNHVIRKVTTTGIINTAIGNGTGGFSGDGGQASSAEIMGAGAMIFDVVGNMYIADVYNNRIRKVNSQGIITTIAGNGTAGFTGDGGQASSAELNRPNGFCIDTIGNLYFSDAGNNRIRKINTSGIISTIAGGGSCGGTPCGDGGPAIAAELYQPNGLCIDKQGNIYVADFSNSRVRKINTAGNIIFIAGNNSWGSFSGDGGQSTNAALNLPVDVAVDFQGNLYIADNYNNRIRKVNSSGIISTIAGGGNCGSLYCGDGGNATAAEIYGPHGLTFDLSGNLYVADNGNNCVRKITNAATIGITTFNVQNSTLHIYPNPAQNNFTIQTNTSDKQTLQVFDVNGNLVLTQTINGTTSIDASTLAQGVYNVSITSSEGVINKRLVIVK